jgi:hypothetical protein
VELGLKDQGAMDDRKERSTEIYHEVAHRRELVGELCIQVFSIVSPRTDDAKLTPVSKSISLLCV